jgi:hypothetical protein
MQQQHQQQQQLQQLLTKARLMSNYAYSHVIYINHLRDNILTKEYENSGLTILATAISIILLEYYKLPVIIKLDFTKSADWEYEVFDLMRELNQIKLIANNLYKYNKNKTWNHIDLYISEYKRQFFSINKYAIITCHKRYMTTELIHA